MKEEFDIDNDKTVDPYYEDQAEQDSDEHDNDELEEEKEEEDNEDTKLIVERLQFLTDKDFKDPLLVIDISCFDELEVEEIPQYYGIHLGVPQNHNDHY